MWLMVRRRFKPADDVKLANDGKWYPADQVGSNGQPKRMPNLQQVHWLQKMKLVIFLKKVMMATGIKLMI